MILPDGDNNLMINALISKPQCDGQTDRFVTTISRSACIGMLMRDESATGKLTVQLALKTECQNYKWGYCAPGAFLMWDPMIAIGLPNNVLHLCAVAQLKRLLR